MRKVYFNWAEGAEPLTEVSGHTVFGHIGSAGEGRFEIEVANAVFQDVIQTLLEAGAVPTHFQDRFTDRMIEATNMPIPDDFDQIEALVRVLVRSDHTVWVHGHRLYGVGKQVATMATIRIGDYKKQKERAEAAAIGA